MYDLVIRGGTIVDGTGGKPFSGDVAISNGVIAKVGTVTEQGREEIDAAGKIVAPGFVDIHTHYDGQATWDPVMAPSSWHGVTTVIMGNCGVGFAPAHPDKHEWLIGLMEGVEDIPGSALAEGITWNWETFPEYIEALDALPRTIDIGTQVPHGSVRAYVMGERQAAGEDPTETDIARMANIVEEGLKAGALGFSTSRTILHKDVNGVLVPGTTATPEELIAIGRAMGRAGHGVFELASDMKKEWDEFGWMGALSRETGRTVAFNMLQSPAKDQTWDEMMQGMARENAKGAKIVASMHIRGTGILMTWRGTVHPFRFRPAWKEIEKLPWAEQLAALKTPEIRTRMTTEANILPKTDVPGILWIIAQGWMMQYAMREGFDYEPQRDETIEALAKATGKTPEEYAYDLMMQDEGTGFIYLPLLNYADGNLDFVEGLLRREDAIPSLSDGGAHCGTICDAASPTYLLQHWVRDRKRGTVPLELAIKRQCRDTALLYGLEDRGLLAPGMLADVNVIDLANLKLGKPFMAFDLPASGRRLLQRADGYVATIKSGRVTFRNGEPTGERPGRVVRGPQGAAMKLAAE